MRIFSALIRTRLSALAAYLFKSSRKKNKGKGMQVLFALLMLYAYGCIGLMFGMLYDQLCKPLCDAGLEWFYFAMAGIVSFAICFVTTVFTAQVQLYEAKDNDLLLSMPIPTRYILASRMVMLLLLSYLSESVAFIPAMIIYGMKFQLSALSLVYFIIIFLFLPLLALVLSCIVGWIVALISSRISNKSIISLVFYLLFLGAYFYGYSKVGAYIQVLVTHGTAIADSIRKVVPPAYYMGIAMEKFDLMSLLIFLLWCCLPMAAAYILLSRSFVKLATTKRAGVKKQYQEKAMKVSSARFSLIKKDLKHFTSSSMYMMNGALGTVFELALAIGLVIKRDMLEQFTAQVPQLHGTMGPVTLLALCLISTMNIVSAPSISLEGKNLWISKSIPVDGGEVLMAKAQMHMLICIPPVIVSEIICALVLDMSVVMTLLLLVVPVLVNVFCALFGVVVNLKFPKFDWINETVAVKQSASTMISMFGSAAVVVGPVLLYTLLASKYMSAELFIGIFAIVMAAVCVGLYRYIMTRGKRIFEELG